MLLGWIKLHRQLLDNWIMTEPEALSVWVRFLLEANHETKKKMLNGALVEIKRGQLIFGLEAFSARSGVSIAKLRRYLLLLEKDGMINRLKTAKYSLITITSFDSYQDSSSLNAGKSQANDKLPATPKECKNDNNVNNKDISCPTNELLKIWSEVMPEKTQPRKGCFDDKDLKARWKSCFSIPRVNGEGNLYDDKDGGLIFWRNFFQWMRGSNFLMEKCNPFGFRWIMVKKNFDKIMNGEYHKEYNNG